MSSLLAADQVDLGWQPHPEVWMLVGSVIVLGVYVARVIAPKIPTADRGHGPAITGRQKGWFALGVVILWLASDWPLHDVAEQYLYSFHMIQHFVLTLVMPPVFWLATPAWLARLVVSPGRRGWGAISRLANPVVASIIFNGMVIATHWTVVVNTSVQVAPVHYLVHLTIVAGAFLMWIPVVGPWPELRLTAPGKCVYLFVQSIIPTVPGAWLTMADGAVYWVYDHGPRLWGITVTEDQQYAGLFMKVAGGAYLWAIIVAIFFKWALALEKTEQRGRIVTIEDGLSYQDVRDEFDLVAPAGAPAPVTPSGTAGPQPPA
jgi:putative membrane protein